MNSKPGNAAIIHPDAEKLHSFMRMFSSVIHYKRQGCLGGQPCRGTVDGAYFRDTITGKSEK